MTERVPAVAEVQGLYGPFSFAEKLLQKIWMRGDFDRRSARLSDGRSVKILYPGKWNLLGGPDFKSARLAFGSAGEITGDVELHLHAVDWKTHGHSRDVAYDRVILHVVLFPPEPGHRTCGVSDHEIPVLALLPLLHHDLEEFAADDAVEVLAGQSAVSAPEELASLEAEKLLLLLRSHAAARWRRKVHFARLRLQRLGAEQAFHHAALEILGYRFNRTPMLRIAGRWPLADWSDPAIDLDAISASEEECWSLQGVRPANLPRVRLRQYAAWTRAVPDWPARFTELAGQLPPVSSDPAVVSRTRVVRREHALCATRDKICRQICGDAIGGTRLDNLICDGLLPLYAAQITPDEGEVTASFDFGIWFHWFPGDQPPALMRTLRQLGVCDGRGQPGCHGFAQGLFNWFLERDARR
jgi:hypothetical protein